MVAHSALSNWQLAFGRSVPGTEWQSLVLYLPFWRMAHASALDQAEQFFSEIGRVIAGPLQRLGHQQDFGSVLEFFALKMSAEESAMHVINFAVGTEDGTCKLNIAEAKTFANLLQHLIQDLGHFEQLIEITSCHFCRQRMSSLGNAPKQIADALEIGAEAQAGKQLARFCFADVGQRSRQLLIDLTLDSIKLFFAVSYGDESHLRAIGEKIFDVEGSVAGYQTCAQRELRKAVLGRARPGFRRFSASLCFQNSSAVSE